MICEDMRMRFVLSIYGMRKMLWYQCGIFVIYPVIEGSVECTPRLEDLYLWLFPEEEEAE